MAKKTRKKNARNGAGRKAKDGPQAPVEQTEVWKLPPAELKRLNPLEIQPGPNARSVDKKAADWPDLRASVKASGVVIPIHVRSNLCKGNEPVAHELIAGARRLAAAIEAGRDEILALDYGEIGDDVAFLIAFLENGHRRDWTPMEAGRACAMLLDKYSEDVQAVASRLGEKPHWVMQHAQIERGLIPGWKAEAKEEDFAEWTVGHWLLIARLPAAIQEKHLGRIDKSDGFGHDRWSIERLEDFLSDDKHPLAKAPFDVTECAQCESRTGFAPLLWPEDAKDGAPTDRCLNGACWKKKAAAAQRDKFQALAEKKDMPQALAINMGEKPDWGGDERAKNLKKLRAVHGKRLVNAFDDNIKVVEEGTKGAIPAIVVGGKGVGSVKWLKVSEKKKTKTSSADHYDWQAEEKKRKERAVYYHRVMAIVTERIVRSYDDLPEEKTAHALVAAFLSPVNIDFDACKVVPTTPNATGEICRWLWGKCVVGLKADVKRRIEWADEHDVKRVTPLAALFGIDTAAILAEVKAEQEKPAEPKKAKPKPPAEGPTVVKLNAEGLDEMGIETVSVPLDPKFKAKVEIFLGQASARANPVLVDQIDAGKWFAGCKCHIPGSGLDKPYPATDGSPDRAGALMLIGVDVVDWLNDKKGRKTYKHYDAVREAVEKFCGLGEEPPILLEEPEESVEAMDAEAEEFEEDPPDAEDGDN